MRSTRDEELTWDCGEFGQTTPLLPRAQQARCDDEGRQFCTSILQRSRTRCTIRASFTQCNHEPTTFQHARILLNPNPPPAHSTTWKVLCTRTPLCGAFHPPFVMQLQAASSGSSIFCSVIRRPLVAYIPRIGPFWAPRRLSKINQSANRLGQLNQTLHFRSLAHGIFSFEPWPCLYERI